MHGGEAARRIRQLVPGVLVFALSATDRNDPHRAGYEDAFDDFLGKPYDLERIQGLLASAGGMGHGEADV
jgi:CheY-like chemotaxis protein